MSGDGAADVPVRDAATVVLLRDGATGLEVFLLTRVGQMAFAAGMTVFPGGRVDPADVDVPVQGAAVTALAARFGCAAARAHALLVAGMRETFEETGVLLTVPAADLGPAELAARRADVEQGRLPFGDLLRAHGLAVDAGALRPWARWVTPAGEARRYDTHFFVGALPAGSQALHVTGEASASSWVSVGEAIEAGQRGERKILPPTMTTLISLLAHATVADVLQASDARSLTPVCPQVRIADDGSASVLLPDGTTMPMPRAEPQ